MPANSNPMQLTMELFSCQQQASSAMMEAQRLRSSGDVDGALRAQRREIETWKKAWELVRKIRELGPSPLEPGTFVQPLRNALFIAADLEWSLGNRDGSEALREEAMELARQHQGESDVMRARRERASGRAFAGRFNEALDDYGVVFEYFQKHDLVGDALRSAVDQAGLYEWLGDYERALATLEKAEAIVPVAKARVAADPDALKALEGSVTVREAQTQLLNAFGLVHRARGDYARARPYFEQVLERQGATGAGPAVEYQLALCDVRGGQPREGLAALRRIEPAFRAHGLLRPKLGVVLKLQAEALLQLDEPEQALALLDEAIADLRQYADLDSQWRLEELRARTLAALKREDESLDAWMSAAATVDDLHSSPLGYRLDSTYLRDKIPFFQAAIATAQKAQRAPECLRFMEMVKARSLAASLGAPRGTQPTGSDLESEFRELSARIDALEYHAWQGGASAVEERSRLLANRARVLERLHQADPRWRNLSTPPVLDVEALVKSLAERRQALLSLFRTPERVTAVLINGGTISVGARPLEKETIEALDEHDRNLQRSTAEIDSLIFDVSEELGVMADDLVPEDLLGAALTADSLVVAPHGAFHLLPWACLLLEDRRLFEHCPVGVVPSAATARLLLEDPAPRPHLAAIGAPDYSELPALDRLESVDAAAQEIYAAYEKSGRTLGTHLRGEQATEPAFWDLARRDEGGILLAICHGRADVEDPLSSALLLADSKVDMAEIARSRIRYDEVVLGACSTGWRPQAVGEVQLVGDEVLSLPGAFLEAGARSVLVSIPPADDDVTAEFLRRYFEFRLEEGPLRALQGTQLAMQRQTGIAPSLWVGFSLYGTS